MIEKEVRVRIDSQMIMLIDPDEENNGEKTEYITDGMLCDKGDTVELSYPESTDMGFEEDTRTTLLFDKRFPLRVNMTRSGSNTAGLSFDPESKRQPCAVSVGEMSMQFCILTRQVENSLTMNGGKIDLDYILEFNGCSTQRTILSVDVAPKLGEATEAL